MAENTSRYREYRRTVAARYGHFRIDRMWFRTKLPNERASDLHYSVVFEVDASGELDMGGITAQHTQSPSDLRLAARFLAWVWRRAHSPPPESRPQSVPYYRRRVWALDMDVEGTPPEEWYQDAFFRRPDRPMIDVDEAASLIEAAMHELEETENRKGQ